MKTLQHFVSNGDGWHLSLYQTWDPDKLRTDRLPVLIVPGYGMNSFIFSYHPRGISLEGFLAEAGLEVWRVDLRAQGESRSIGGGENFGLEDLAATDLSTAIDALLDRTRTGQSSVAVLGASLGGTIMFSHAALIPKHRIAAMVAIGSPVRWVEIHPAIRLAFGSPTLVGFVRLRGTRQIAHFALPYLLKHTPWVLSLYMNPEHVDPRAVSELVRTVEDPNRYVNKQIARWIRDKDLVLRGTNVSTALANVRSPLLCVVANGDGIVPRATAEFSYRRIGTHDRTLLEVGSPEMRLAHADMFVSGEAHERVYAPVRDWLLERG
ncbi:MAG: alpha/beta fold hydrolase [Myxococcales bacterium]|nr:alpha/beta fold hydrolase [Myxococcales bacterium]